MRNHTGQHQPELVHQDHSDGPFSRALPPAKRPYDKENGGDRWCSRAYRSCVSV
jgi:hypothetical protein